MIAPHALRDEEIEFVPIRAQGAGGQNVDKVSNAVQLRFDVRASSLPDEVKRRLLALSDQRMSEKGVIVIKAQRFRSLEKNRQDARARLEEMVARASLRPKPRKPTQPTRASQLRRLESKLRRGRVKALRGRVTE
ncbi:MAG: alternative ribosome rescue aminoacyl-tRNA hydrolase ArfB [Pseudomonadota bacterium]